MYCIRGFAPYIYILYFNVIYNLTIVSFPKKEQEKKVKKREKKENQSLMKDKLSSYSFFGFFLKPQYSCGFFRFFCVNHFLFFPNFSLGRCRRAKEKIL